MLLKRGPNAYNNFIKALSLTSQHQVLEILDATRSRLGYPAHEISLPTNGRSAKLPMRENEKEGANSFSYPQTPVSAEYKYTHLN